VKNWALKITQKFCIFLAFFWHFELAVWYFGLKNSWQRCQGALQYLTCISAHDGSVDVSIIM
jgi:hypothetical protein